MGMINDRWIPYITCGLGLGFGALATLMWRAPDVVIAACPKGLSGLWICPQEWQTGFAGFLALVGGSAVYFAARYQSDAIREAQDKELRRQKRAIAVMLVAELRHAIRIASASRITILKSIREEETISLERLNALMPSPVELGPELRTRVGIIDPDLASSALQAITATRLPRETFARLADQHGGDAEVPAQRLHATLEALNLILAPTGTIVVHLMKYQEELRD